MITSFLKKIFQNHEVGKNFLEACQFNDLSEIQNIVNDLNFNEINDTYNDGFIAACEKLDSKVAVFLLEHPVFSLYLNMKFKYQGRMLSLKELGYGCACKSGNTNLVEFFIQEHGEYQVDLKCQNNYGLKWICSEGHTDILIMLLSSPFRKIVLTKNDAIIIEHAVAQEQYKIIDILIYHVPDEDYAFWCEQAIKRAIDNEQHQVIEYFFNEFNIIIDSSFNQWLLNDENYDSFDMRNFIQGLLHQYANNITFAFT